MCALSCLCIPVSNAVVEWVFSRVTFVFKMWKSVILNVDKTGINTVSCLPVFYVVFLVFSTAQWWLRYSGLNRFLDYDLYWRTGAFLHCIYVPPSTVPLHYVVNSGSFLWTFSLFIYFRCMSGLSQEANFHFRGLGFLKLETLLEGLRRLMSYKISTSTCSLHSLDKLFQFINILPYFILNSLDIRNKNSHNEANENGSVDFIWPH